jgi:hypothetical protein
MKQKAIILASLLLFSGMLSHAQTTDMTSDNRKEILDGYYDTAAKKLIFTGPAAEAVWNQMANIPEEVVVAGIEIRGRSKESNGTYCEKTLYRPRPLAASVAFYTCNILQASVAQ